MRAVHSSRISAFVLPLGYSFNLDGTMMYCTFASVFIAQTYQIDMSLGTQLAMLATLMIPFQVIMIPTFLIIRSAGLIDTLPALILPNLASGFGIFMMRQFFRTLPIELEEAARIDGAGPFLILIRIVLPLSLPAIAVAVDRASRRLRESARTANWST